MSSSLAGLCEIATLVDESSSSETSKANPSSLHNNSLPPRGAAALAAPNQASLGGFQSFPQVPVMDENQAMALQNMIMQSGYLNALRNQMFMQSGFTNGSMGLNQQAVNQSLFAQQLHYAAMMGYNAALNSAEMRSKATGGGGVPTVPPVPAFDSLTGTKNTGKWKDDEIALLRRGIEDYGRDWVKIAKLIPTRTREQVKNKGYAMILEDKTPNKSTGHWKSFELEALQKGMQDFGPDWHRIALDIPTRSWSQIVRKGKHMIDGGEVVLDPKYQVHSKYAENTILEAGGVVAGLSMLPPAPSNASSIRAGSTFGISEVDRVRKADPAQDLQGENSAKKMRTEALAGGAAQIEVLAGPGVPPTSASNPIPKPTSPPTASAAAQGSGLDGAPGGGDELK